MKLKELRTMIAGNVVICEESKKHDPDTCPDYIDIFEGDCRHIPQELYERDILVFSGVNKLGKGCLEVILEPALKR